MLAGVKAEIGAARDGLREKRWRSLWREVWWLERRSSVIFVRTERGGADRVARGRFPDTDGGQGAAPRPPGVARQRETSLAPFPGSLGACTLMGGKNGRGQT